MIIENPITPLTEIFDPLFEQRQIRFLLSGKILQMNLFPEINFTN